MKDNDDMLRAALPRPARELSSNFSARVVAELKAHDTESQKEYTPMKFRLAPMIATIVAAVIVLVGGGVTYAATDGFTKPFNLENIFGYKTVTEPNGGKVLAVQTANCTVGAVDAPKGNADQTLYFRLKQVSEADAMRWLQGYCESISAETFYSTLRDTYMTTDNTVSSGVVTSATDRTIDITDDETRTNVQFAITASTKIDRSSHTSNTFTAGDYVTVVTVSNDSATPQVAQYIIHQSSNAKFYTDNAEKYRAGMDRVQPCGDTFCAYGSGSPDSSDTSQEAVAFIMNAYEPYQTSLEVMSDDWLDQLTRAKQAFYQHTTAQLATKLERTYAVDPIICAQNVVPGIISYGTPIMQGTNVIVPVVHRRSDADQNPRVFADVSYSLVQKKIVSIDCTQHLDQYQ